MRSFVLVGAPDPGNPNTVTEAELRGWEAEGLVRWLGPRKDIAVLLRGAHIACQPSSYREGLPKSALEAMAGRQSRSLLPIFRAAERRWLMEKRGFLVPVRDPTALAEALRKLIESPQLRARMGMAGRQRAELYFGDVLICRQTLFGV